MAEEKNFENRIKDFLKEEGCWFVKYWSGKSATGKTFTKEGIPDILCCCNGRFVAIEVKGSKGKASDLQLYNLFKIDEAGGYAVLLYPEQFECFKNFIRCLNESDFLNASLNYVLMKERWKKDADFTQQG